MCVSLDVVAMVVQVSVVIIFITVIDDSDDDDADLGTAEDDIRHELSVFKPLTDSCVVLITEVHTTFVEHADTTGHCV